MGKKDVVPLWVPPWREGIFQEQSPGEFDYLESKLSKEDRLLLQQDRRSQFYRGHVVELLEPKNRTYKFQNLVRVHLACIQTTCIQWCPTEAIEFADKTSTRRQYKHPEVKISDLLS